MVAILVLFLALGLIDSMKAFSIKDSVIIVPQDYPTLQEAVNAASPGETIYVYSGNYAVRTIGLIIDKPLTLIGENSTDTVIDGTKGLTALQVNADNVSIKGFTIKCEGLGRYGEGYWYSFISAVVKIFANHTTIESNILSGSTFGVFVGNYSNTNIDEFYPGEHSYNIIRNNLITRCDVGIWLEGETNANLIEDNNISCPQFGIKTDGSNEDTIQNNTITGSANAISLNSCETDEILNNTVTENHSGVAFDSTRNTRLVENTIADNDMGIMLNNAQNNTIYHNDFLLNREQASINSPCINAWDNGTEGNYWSDYNGPDTDADGIGDRPFYLGGLPVEIDNINIDRFPLIYPHILSFDQVMQIAIMRIDELSNHLNDLQSSIGSINSSKDNLNELINNFTIILDDSIVQYQGLNSTFPIAFADFEQQYGYFNSTQASVFGFIRMEDDRLNNLSIQIYNFPLVLLIVDLIVAGTIVGVLSAKSKNLKKTMILTVLTTIIITSTLTQAAFQANAHTIQMAGVRQLNVAKVDDLQSLSQTIDNLTAETELLQSQVNILNAALAPMVQIIDYLSNRTRGLQTDLRTLDDQSKNMLWQYEDFDARYQYMNSDLANLKDDFAGKREHLTVAEGFTVFEAALFPLFLFLLIPRTKSSKKIPPEKIISSVLIVTLLLVALSANVPKAHSTFDASVSSATASMNSVVAENVPNNVSSIAQLVQLVYELGQLTDQVASLQTSVSSVDVSYNDARSNVNSLNDTLNWDVSPNQVAKDYFSFQNGYNVTNTNFVALSDYYNTTKQDFIGEMNAFETLFAIISVLTIVVPVVLMLLAARIWTRKIDMNKKKLDDELSGIRK